VHDRLDSRTSNVIKLIHYTAMVGPNKLDYSNFLSAMYVSQRTRLYCQPDMTSSSVHRQMALHLHVLDGFWRSDHDLIIASRNNFSSGMHGFRDNEVLLQARYDVIVIFPPGALNAIWHDGFWKSNHDFLIACHSNFLSGMHAFRDNEVLLQAGYDVIVISQLGGASRYFTKRILKERPWLSDSVPS